MIAAAMRKTVFLLTCVVLLAICASAQKKAPFSSIRPRLLAISVAELTRAEAFYRDNFGFRTLSSRDFPDYGLKIASLELNGFRLEIIQLKNVKDRRALLPDPDNDASISGFNKFDFQVENSAELLDHLKSRGVKTFNVCSTENSSSFMLRDPDGNLWQFLSRKPLPKQANARSLPNGCWPGPVN